MDERVSNLYIALYGADYRQKYEPTNATKIEMISAMHSALSDVKRYKTSIWNADRVTDLLSDRSGLSTGKVKTLKSCGEEQGVSAGRIRQVEATAMRMLRHPRHLHLFLKERL